MRNSNACPKCDSTKILQLKGNRWMTGSLVYLNQWATKYMVIDRYVCATCGYLEEYAQPTKIFKKWCEEQTTQKGDWDEFV